MIKYIFKKGLSLFPRPFLIRVSYIVKPVFALFLKGSKYTDPIDEKSFRSFLPYGCLLYTSPSPRDRG